MGVQAVRRLAAAAVIILGCLLIVPVAAPPASAATGMAWGGSSAGNAALNWAEAHAAGQWYLYGGNGPRYDCSGLVVAAFAHADGITLPRVSYSMPSNPHLHYIPWQQAKRGDILVWGNPRSPSHVGFKTAYPWTSFEARNTGLRIWWMSYFYFRPSAAYRVW